MKKLIVIGIILGILAGMLPSVASGDLGDCRDYEVGSCCWRLCCAEVTYTYAVSYFEYVDSGFRTNWGAIMWSGIWTTVLVEARNSVEAAESLGKRAGYSCFVSRVLDES